MKNKILIYLSLISLIIIFYLTLPDNKARVVVCDVSQGDAILATYKNIQMLIDVGPDNKKVLKCLENHLPFWDKTIEVVILTHGDSDHIGGLDDLLKSYKVKKFFSNGLLEQEVEQKIYSQKVAQNDRISIGLFQFEVVSPPADSFLNLTGEKDNNENSVVGILRLDPVLAGKEWSMFMSGDMGAETEQRLVWREILKNKVDVLKVSHHGSDTGTSDEILEILKPKVAVISVGKNNRFDHPREEVIERLKGIGATIKRTDQEGELVFKY
jgi:competence protein ComEC